MILIVDDDPSVTASVALLLKQAGRASASVSSPAATRAWLEQNPCELVPHDMNFSRQTSGEEGIRLLMDIKERWPVVPVILMTAWGSIALAVEGMKAGASDFVTKPWSNQQLAQTVQTVLGIAAATSCGGEHAATREELDARYDFGGLVGQEPRFLRVLEVVGRVAATDASVLITARAGPAKSLLPKRFTAIVAVAQGRIC